MAHCVSSSLHELFASPPFFDDLHSRHYDMVISFAFRFLPPMHPFNCQGLEYGSFFDQMAKILTPTAANQSIVPHVRSLMRPGILVFLHGRLQRRQACKLKLFTTRPATRGFASDSNYCSVERESWHIFCLPPWQSIITRQIEHRQCFKRIPPSPRRNLYKKNTIQNSQNVTIHSSVYAHQTQDRSWLCQTIIQLPQGSSLDPLETDLCSYHSRLKLCQSSLAPFWQDFRLRGTVAYVCYTRRARSLLYRLELHSLHSGLPVLLASSPVLST